VIKGSGSARLLLLVSTISIAANFVRSEGTYSPGLLSFNGYVKSFFTLYSFTDKQSGWFDLDRAVLASVNNRLRFKVGVSPVANFRFDAAYEIVAVVRDRELSGLDVPGLSPDSGGYRVVDLRSRIIPKAGAGGGSFGLFHNLDRLSLTWRLPAADVTVGRQVVAWGSARIVNPTDVLIPFSFNELDKEERTGIDALRVRIPLGAMSELDAGWIPGSDFRLSRGAAFLRGRFPLGETDVSLLLMNFRRHLMIGLDLARSLGGAGLWLEASYVAPGAFGSGDGLEEPDYVRLSAGADHQIGGKTYAFVEYHFNGAGEVRAREYSEALGTSAYRDGAVYLLGRHYLGGGVTYQLTPLVPLTSVLLWNLGDGSAMALFSGEYNIAENIYLQAGIHLGAGRGPEAAAGIPPGPDLGINSELGLYPDLVFASFRVYF
jgi:hypothetical protein